MLRNPAEPNIAPEDTWEGGVLSREPHGRLLSQLLTPLQGSYLLSLKGGWGTGKHVAPYPKT